MISGFVSLVGAGPGDPDHLTQKAARRLREADLVLHDALVSNEVRALAERALHINVGKRGGGEQTPQQEIERLLIEAAQQGMRVVRLKGGDPFVFGRGGEEALALQRAGIAYEVVPGVTSAISAPALAGIPVTHRGVSSGFIVINGADLDTTDRALASTAPGLLTVVLLMAIGRRAQIAQRLLDRGWDASTPAAIILGAATPEMQTWRGSLAGLMTVTLPESSRAGTIVLGDVAALPIELMNGIPVSQEMAR
jgi:uroporphyrin-III C-methyltransferase/precorrin-2 dehydrogenase/sirohydrochlorin ferrochelatase